MCNMQQAVVLQRLGVTHFAEPFESRLSLASTCCMCSDLWLKAPTFYEGIMYSISRKWKLLKVYVGHIWRVQGTGGTHV